MSSPPRSERVDIAIVGGGLAGAALAARLARAGREVVVLERSPTWRWRAGGVFSSPAAMAALRRLGLDESTLQTVARPIPAMRVETPAKTTFRLTYGADDGGPTAVGFDRSRLDPAMLELARVAGADVRLGVTVTSAALGDGELGIRSSDGGFGRMRTNVIVGADGPRSVVATAAGVGRTVRMAARIGLTYHLEDPEPLASRDARLGIFRDGYVGIAPVAGGRINIGIVLGASWRTRLTRFGASRLAAMILASTPAMPDDPIAGEIGDPAAWKHSLPTEAIVGAWPLGHRVTHRAGPGWMLVGDAAGFLDPFTGEGLHRALVSSELAATAIEPGMTGPAGAYAAYDRQMQRRFATKDAVSWLVQAFLARPALFEYAARRLASRPGVRATMGLVMGDLVPAGRALDPLYLAGLLAP